MRRKKAITKNHVTAGFVKKIDEISARNSVKYVVYASSLVFFFALIFTPPIAGIIENIGKLWEIQRDSSLFIRANLAVINSFVMAFIVAVLDLVAALPLAWFIVRSRMKYISFIDALVDIPFLIPTAALGYSALLFWSSPNGVSKVLGVESLIPLGFPLVLLLHFTFSYPVIVRIMVGELLTYKEVYEVAARTLGAQPFTAVRTITLPLLKPGIIAAFLLAFARSLSETGATVMVAGNFENGAVFIFKNIGVVGESVLVYVSSLLLLSSVVILFLIRSLAPKFRFPVRRAFPSIEEKLSSLKIVRLRNVLTLFVFLTVVIIPSLFVALPMVEAFFNGTINEVIIGLEHWHNFWWSMSISYAVSFISMLINIVFGLPTAILIARRKLGKATQILKALISIPIIVPSISLGVSLRLFWGKYAFIPEFLIIVLSHTSITYTYFVESVAAAIESIPKEIEEAASTLGAKPFRIFRKITLPLTKYAIFAGAILVFTRALGETGAAKAVIKTPNYKTLPVLLIEWINSEHITEPQRALGAGIYILSSFIALLVLRFLTRRGEH